MTVLVLTNCPPKLRGDLTKWFLEVNTNVYVGNINVRVRDEIWERICSNVKSGRATMVFKADNEQKMDFRIHNTSWIPVDYDGIKLILHPKRQFQEGTSQTAIPDGFSKAAKFEKSKTMMRRKRLFRYYSQLILFLGTMPRLWPGFISAKNTIRDKIQLVLIFFFKVPISLDNDIGMLYNSTNRRC